MPSRAQQRKAVEPLPGRCLGVLREIVRQYVFDGSPVGSDMVAEVYSEGLSSASIRKVMARLEDSGLLMQPHPSSGRIPTDLGYRCYVDRFARKTNLGSEEQRRVDSGLEPSSEVSGLLDAASRLLSKLTHSVAVVVAPDLGTMKIRNIEFVRISESRVMAVFVSETGGVTNRVVEIDSLPPQEDLERYARMLVDEFGGRTLPQMHEVLTRRMIRERQAYDRLARSAMDLGLKVLAAGTERDPDVFLEGTTRILGQPEMADLGRMRALLEALHRKERIVHLLGECLEQEDVGALIGTESGQDDLHEFSLVAAAYCFRGQPVGTVGIIGPTRMEYERNLALVRHVAGSLGSILTEVYS